MRMLPSSRILNLATSQRDRLLGSPAPEAVQVDGRSLAQLLTFAGEYGALVQFYDLGDRPDGDWSQFFAADPAVIQAMHVALDLPEIERSLQHLLARIRAAPDRHAYRRRLRRMLGMLARLIGILDRSHTGSGEEEARFHRAASHPRRDGLSEPLQRYCHHLARLPLDRHGAWEDNAGDSSWDVSFLDVLDDIVVTLIAELDHGAAAAAAALEASLATGDHAPQAALFNAFAILLKEACGTLNLFPRRLVDFYYGEVLRQHDLAAEPDQLFLTFLPAPGADQASVPRGAAFPAGTDADGEAINYEAASALEVAPVTVTGLSVHRVATGSGSSGDDAVATTVLSGSIDLQPDAPDASTLFPMFGTLETGQFGPLTMKRASLGFSLASPVLLLAGGERTIEVELVVTLTSVDSMRSGASGEGEGERVVADIARLIEQTFCLYYSTPGGWMEVEEYAVTGAFDPNRDAAAAFTLLLRLPDDAPPVAPASGDPDSDSPKPTLAADAYPDLAGEAAIVGRLKPGPAEQLKQEWSALGRFAILGGLRISDIRIRVDVRGLTGLRVTTPTGPANLSQNFNIFGLPPARGAALSIAAPELFAKPIDSLSVAINWAGLPVNRTGFLGYYRDYIYDADGIAADAPLFDNGSFRVAVSVVNPGLWSVAARDPLYLFQDAPGAPPASPPQPAAPPSPAGPVAATSVLAPPLVRNAAAPPYYNPDASALRIELVGPAYAFGDVLYSSNLMAVSAAQSAASIDRARGHERADGSGPPPTLPNPPWAPIASGISVDYSAAVDLTLPAAPPATPAGLAAQAGLAAAQAGASGVSDSSPVSFRHIAPFDRIKAPADGGDVALLPAIEPDAALYIQLSAPVRQLSLLLILAAGPDGWWSDPPTPIWEQYIKGRWTQITVLDDGTDGLSTSGVVALELRPHQQAGSKPRIRVRAIGSAHNAPLVQSITANAVKARWVGPGGASSRGTPLPAGTITKSTTKLANIKGIAQPMQSFGGRPPARGPAFQQWMAERLRHKGLAIDSWDYARIVLAAVPSLWQAAVVPATDEATGGPAPGKVWIVAVAGPNTPNVTDTTAPLVDLATLAEIGNLVEARISPFIEVKVTNPTYLRLRVSAEILFCDDDTSAFWERQLEAELIEWLSPWVPSGSAGRPRDYYTRSAVTEFIHSRSYVRGIINLHLRPDEPAAGAGSYYLTSALQHHLRGRTDHSRRPALGDGFPAHRPRPMEPTA
jgi:hypothetical protein